MQHAGSRYSRENCIRCHSYPILKNHDLPEAKATVYGESFALWSNKAAIPILINLDQQEGDCDEDAVMRNWSSKTSDSEKSKLELYEFMLKTGNFSDVD